MNGFVADVSSKGSELDKFDHKGEGQMTEQNRGTLVERNPIAKIVFACETPLEKKQRAYRCPHGNITVLCLACAGIAVDDAKKWNLLRSNERHIDSHGPNVDSRICVRISRNDCVLISRSERTVPANDISDWYECGVCYKLLEIPASRALTRCPKCGQLVHYIAEPFQRTSFSAYVGNGAGEENYAGAYSKRRNTDGIAARDLYSDANSRFQKGGTGYLRMPLDAPRNTRGDAPDWLPARELFIETLKHSHSQRAERILRGFYHDGKTDKQLAESEGWATDSIKKERHDLVRRGTDFFRINAA